MKKRLKLRTGVKVVITVIVESISIVMFHYLGVLGAYVGKNKWVDLFLLLGWIWAIIRTYLWALIIWGDC